MSSRMNILASIAVFAFGSLAMGCYAEAGTYVESQDSVVYDDSPTLVAIEPGVWVVSRQPTAVYYVNDCYWTYRQGNWYRSTDWDGTWVSMDVAVVPTTIVHRNSARFVNYHSYIGAETRPLPHYHYGDLRDRHGKIHARPRIRRNDLGTREQNNNPWRRRPGMSNYGYSSGR